MPQFRKKPTVIEANQYFKSLCPTLDGVCRCEAVGDRDHLHTAHNRQSVFLEDGDWIVPEPDGSGYYPIKHNIFKEQYEAV